MGVEVKLANIEVAKVPTGEKVSCSTVPGHNVMRGYYKTPEEIKNALHNGWMHIICKKWPPEFQLKIPYSDYIVSTFPRFHLSTFPPVYQMYSTIL